MKLAYVILKTSNYTKQASVADIVSTDQETITRIRDYWQAKSNEESEGEYVFSISPLMKVREM